MYHKKFQPLRIYPDWRVSYNFFYEEQITEENIHKFEGPTLLIVESERRNQYIEVAWRPEGDISGAYVLEMYNTREVFNPKNNTLESKSDLTPHTVFESRIKQEIVDKLEDAMWFSEGYKDPRILKKRGEVDEPSESYRLALEKNGLTDEIVEKILTDGNKQIQHLSLDHPDMNKDMLTRFFNKTRFPKMKKKAEQKLKNKKFR